MQMQATIRMEHTCDGIGFECRWALGGLGFGRDTSPTQYSPVTDAAGRHVACLLALDAHAGARGDAFRDGDADGRGSRSFRVSRRVCVERIGVLPIGSTSINLGLVSYKMDCKLIELKHPILLYTKMYFIFWGPFKFGGPVRSHSPYRPKDAPARRQPTPPPQLVGLAASRKFCTTSSGRKLLIYLSLFD